ncbi:MAG TPA: hypothetical protein ENN99_11065 [Chloroflexi bacterium]|nr:hypothetical protein [Chloroflexota bacterium]
MARRSSSRRPSRRTLETRAPRKATLVIATALYLVGLLGVLDLLPIPDPFATAGLALAGGLLILGALLRGL